MKQHLAKPVAFMFLFVLATFTVVVVGTGSGQEPVKLPLKQGQVDPSPVQAVQRIKERTGPEQDALQMIQEGRQSFRFDTFGDEHFWDDALKLHLAIIGNKLGGAGPGVSPKTALAVGLKVDMDALPKS